MPDDQTPPSRKITPGDVTGLLALGVAVFSTACYTFALGYFNAVGSLYITAFPVSDLLTLGASHVGMMMIWTLFFLTGIISISALTAHTGRSIFDANGFRYLATVLAIMYLIAITVVSFNADVGAYSVYRKQFPYILMLILTVLPYFYIRKTTFRNVLRMVLFAGLGLMSYINAFAAGDYIGNRDLRSIPRDSVPPCAFVEGKKNCFHLLLLGSDGVLLVHRGQVIWMKRDKLRHVQVPTSEISKVAGLG